MFAPCHPPKSPAFLLFSEATPDPNPETQLQYLLTPHIHFAAKCGPPALAPEPVPPRAAPLPRPGGRHLPDRTLRAGSAPHLSLPCCQTGYCNHKFDHISLL